MIPWYLWASLIFVATLATSEKECIINSGESIKYELLEDQPVYVPFLTVSTSSADDIAVKCDEDVVGFDLNNDAGKLSLFLKKSILHFPDEDVPKVSIECLFMCNSKHTSVYLNLEIKNVYNNIPEFIDSPYEYSISEFTTVGTAINPNPIVMFDRDYPESETVMEVEAKANKPGIFSFSSLPPIAYGKYLNLYIVLNATLDYSQESMYSINLTVKDRGDPPNINKTTVTIHVIDEDDQDPIFGKFLYYSEIIINQTKEKIYLRNKDDGQDIPYEDLSEENDGILPLIIGPDKIFAFDQDFGINASINYALGKENDYIEYFKINKEEGSIFLKKIEERMITNYSFIVPLEAYQTDNEKRRAKAALVVKITVVSPVQPHFTHPIYIPKTLLANDSFYLVGTLQDDIKYQILDAENQYIFVDEATGSLSLLQNASQLPPAFKFDVIAETSVPSINNKFQGHFEVIERDPLKTPLFNKSVYFVEVSKTTKRDDHLFMIKINDPKAELHLMGNDSKYFDIVKKNVNWIILKDELVPDRTSYSVIIKAVKKDDTSIMERDEAKVIFQVTDSECQHRIFEKDLYLVDMSSDWKVGNRIFSISLKLLDVSFTLSGEHADHFSIESDGTVYLMKQINICERSELFLYGELKVPPYVNDNAEIILISRDKKCHAEIFENDAFLIDISPEWKIGENIFNFTSVFPEVAFTLEDGDSYFNLNPITGQLFLTAQLIECKRYELSVNGESKGPPPKTGVTKLILISEVCVKKTREFSKCVYTVTIKSKETKEKILLDFRENNNENSDMIFEISVGNPDGLFDIEDGKLILTRQPTVDGQYFLKVVQKKKEKVSRSGERHGYLDISNEEALVIVNIGERKGQIRFLDPNNWFKLFLPTAPLSDYWFTVKAVAEGEMNSIKFSIKAEDSMDFEVDSRSGLISPKIDVTKIEGYKRDLNVSATAANNETAELHIHIRRLRYNNLIGITLKNNPANVINLKSIERAMSTALQCDVHILRYKRKTDSESYELLAGAIKDKLLLTVQELEERMKSKTEDLQHIIGDFSVAPYREKVTKGICDETKVDSLLISTVLLAFLSVVLCVLLLVFVIRHKCQ